MERGHAGDSVGSVLRDMSRQHLTHGAVHARQPVDRGLAYRRVLVEGIARNVADHLNRREQAVDHVGVSCGRCC